ncbi:MAG TPA: hypothetical protein VGJ22_09930 [Anaerolineales bacterium]|jgi:hypothetical protein
MYARRVLLVCALTLSWTACAPLPTAPGLNAVTASSFPTETPTLPALPPSQTSTPSATSTTSLRPSATASATETQTATASAIPTAASLQAQVTADLLSCRYGPGPEYLYLYGLRKTANIELIGRTDGDNWHWVYVNGRNKCWVNAKFLDIQGDWLSLPIVYPGLAKIPRSPYYNPTDFVGATRQGNIVEVSWNPIRLREGDAEDEFMLLYIAEIWRCQGGQIYFEPLATNDTSVTFVDQAGCSRPSHGRVYFQEKHGYAGPSEVPWPRYKTSP